jgi:hypothetical protein
VYSSQGITTFFPLDVMTEHNAIKRIFLMERIARAKSQNLQTAERFKIILE